MVSIFKILILSNITIIITLFLSILGKSIENVMKYRSMYLVSQWEFKGKKYSARKLIAQPNVKSIKIICEDLVLIEMQKLTVYFNRPTYIGAIVLEHSKRLNYEFFYNFLKKKFKQEAFELLYCDTVRIIIFFTYE